MTAAPRPRDPAPRLLRRIVEGARTSWDAPPLVPRGLVAALAVWPLLLFAFFALPEVRYQNAPPLFAMRPQTPASGGEPATEPRESKRPVAVLVRAMEGDLAQPSEQDNRSNHLRRLAGTNILAASGYLDAAYSELIGEGELAVPYYRLVPNWAVSECARVTVDDDKKARAPIAQATRLALAIVAVEKFNRNAMHRFAERNWAALYRSAFGELPDLSFGPAQVRLSLLRRVAAEHRNWPSDASPSVIASVEGALALWSSLDNDELLAELEKECRALQIVATLVLSQLALSPNMSTEDLAAAYAGQRRRRSRAVIDYAGIVSAMVDMISID